MTPKQVDPDRQRRRIREAAREVFARSGLSGTGLRHVAAEAGMTRSNLYHYYPDKEALVRDLADSLLDEERRLFERTLREKGSVRERLEKLLLDVVDLYRDRTAESRLLLELWAAELDHMGTLVAQYREALAKLLRLARDAGEIDEGIEPAACSVLTIGLLDGLVLQLLLDPDALPDRDALAGELRNWLRRVLEPISSRA